jgi:WD40 repeat protein
VLVVELSQDELQVASGGEDHVIALSEAATGERVRALVGHTLDVFDIAFSHGGDRPRIASASRDGTIRLWDAQTGAPIGNPMLLGSRAYGVAFSADDRFVAGAAKDGTIRVFSLDAPATAPRILRAHRAAAYSLKFSADSRLLVSAGEDRAIRLFSTVDFAEVGRAPLKDAPVGVRVADEVAARTGLRVEANGTLERR